MVLFALSESWHEPLESFIKIQKGITITRKTFRFNRERFYPLRNWRDMIPEGYIIKPINKEVIEQNILHDMKLDTWSSSGAFLKNGTGTCLLHDDEVISEASTLFVGRGIAEFGVHTVEQYRGQGFATLTAAACIEACLEKGLRPRCACWPERKASIALAKKLGFEEYKDVPAYYWRASPMAPIEDGYRFRQYAFLCGFTGGKTDPMSARSV